MMAPSWVLLSECTVWVYDLGEGIYHGVYTGAYTGVDSTETPGARYLLRSLDYLGIWFWTAESIMT